MPTCHRKIYLESELELMWSNQNLKCPKTAVDLNESYKTTVFTVVL